jgi:uncharacterized membrane protein
MLDRFAADSKGNIAILFSLLFGAMSVATALAIDSAALYLERRRIQGAVDIAAISAAHWMGATHFRTRGLKNVATEASLTVLAYNIKQAIAVAGVASTLKAIEG